MSFPSRTTMQDVARHAQVSKMSVSLALRGKPGISEATRKRILEVAEELNYRPDPALSALTTYRHTSARVSHQGTLAFFFFDDHVREPRQPYVREMLNGCRRRAEELGYRIEHYPGPKDAASGRRLKQILKARGIRGIILSPVVNTSHPPVFDWEEFSVVALGVSYRNHFFHTVSPDTYYSGQLCVDHLVKSGYRRIGLQFRTDQVERVNWRYVGGAMSQLYRYGETIEIIPPLVNEQMPWDSFHQWFLKHRPDALITGHSEILMEMREHGYTIPDDLAIICPFVVSAIDISHVDERCDEIGYYSIDIVHDLLRKQSYGIPVNPTEKLIRGRIVSLASVGSIPAEIR